MENEGKILFLGGGWKCFSNFSSYEVDIWGKKFKTSEHAYQYKKFEHDTEVKERIFDAPSAYDSKMLSIEFKDRQQPDWGAKKVAVMEEILHAKLAQHPHIRKKLLETGDREIIEDSKDDYFWGWGADHTGQNIHGKLWMKFREEIQHHD